MGHLSPSKKGGKMPKKKEAFLKALFDPIAAYEYCKQYGPDKRLEDIISTHPNASLKYAEEVLKKRFKKGEKTIAESGLVNALGYLVKFKMKEYPALKEEIIKRQDGLLAYMYAFYTEKRFKEAEEFIKKENRWKEYKKMLNYLKEKGGK